MDASVSSELLVLVYQLTLRYISVIFNYNIHRHGDPSQSLFLDSSDGGEKKPRALPAFDPVG
jgi:hypothetical protein